jgi:hypothetical protein
MNVKRALAVVLGFVTLIACSDEENSSPTLRPLNGYRDGGSATPANATPAANSVPPLDAGTDSAPPFVDTYVSDLPFTEENGYGPVEKDTSNGENAAGDGVTMMIEGAMYAKGLGVHSSSHVTVDLGGQYTMFLADVGIDDEVGDNGTVVFRVVADGTEIFNSDTMTGADAAKQVSVDVTGVSTLELFVDDGGDGSNFDHSDWADARLRK